VPSSAPPANPASADLITVRDLLRYGVTAFTRAGLVYGHGTATALDEAAFLILSALHLPIDALDPWLDARLTVPERTQILALFARRIETRKPAAYLVNAAYIQGHRFYVDERVIVPRSYIGELICQDGLAALIPAPENVTSVLDMCTGSGCLAILAALAFPQALVDAADISAGALAVARRNVEDYGLSSRVTLHAGDLFAALPGASRYDLIIANPPYVARAEVAAFSPEYRAEPVLAHVGGEDGLDLVRKIIDGAGQFLAPGGMLVVEIGTGREGLEASYPAFDFLWLDTATSEGEVVAIAAKSLTAKPRASRAVR